MAPTIRAPSFDGVYELRPLMDGCLVADRERVEFRNGSVDLIGVRRLINGNHCWRQLKSSAASFLEGLDLRLLSIPAWLVAEREISARRRSKSRAAHRTTRRRGCRPCPRPTAGDARSIQRRRPHRINSDAGALDRNQEALRQYEHCRCCSSRSSDGARRRQSRCAARSRRWPKPATPTKTETYSDEPLIGRRGELDQRWQPRQNRLFTVIPESERAVWLTTLSRQRHLRTRVRRRMNPAVRHLIDALAEHGGFPTDTTDRCAFCSSASSSC